MARRWLPDFACFGQDSRLLNILLVSGIANCVPEPADVLFRAPFFRGFKWFWQRRASSGHGLIPFVQVDQFRVTVQHCCRQPVVPAVHRRNLKARRPDRPDRRPCKPGWLSDPSCQWNGQPCAFNVTAHCHVRTKRMECAVWQACRVRQCAQGTVPPFKQCKTQADDRAGNNLAGHRSWRSKLPVSTSRQFDKEIELIRPRACEDREKWQTTKC